MLRRVTVDIETCVDGVAEGGDGSSETFAFGTVTISAFHALAQDMAVSH